MSTNSEDAKANQCPKCAIKTKQGGKFCHNCGSPLSSSTQKLTPSPVEQNNNSVTTSTSTSTSTASSSVPKPSPSTDTAKPSPISSSKPTTPTSVSKSPVATTPSSVSRTSTPVTITRSPSNPSSTTTTAILKSSANDTPSSSPTTSANIPAWQKSLQEKKAAKEREEKEKQEKAAKEREEKLKELEKAKDPEKVKEREKPKEPELDKAKELEKEKEKEREKAKELEKEKEKEREKEKEKEREREKEKEREREAKEKEKEKEREKAKELEKEKEREREKEKEREREKAKELEKEKEREREAKEKEREKEKEKEREREKEKEKEREAKEKEKQKEKEKEREKEKDKERAKDKEKEKEKERDKDKEKDDEKEKKRDSRSHKDEKEKEEKKEKDKDREEKKEKEKDREKDKDKDKDREERKEKDRERKLERTDSERRREKDRDRDRDKDKEKEKEKDRDEKKDRDKDKDKDRDEKKEEKKEKEKEKDKDKEREKDKDKEKDKDRDKDKDKEKKDKEKKKKKDRDSAGEENSTEKKEQESNGNESDSEEKKSKRSSKIRNSLASSSPEIGTPESISSPALSESAPISPPALFKDKEKANKRRTTSFLRRVFTKGGENEDGVEELTPPHSTPTSSPASPSTHDGPSSKETSPRKEGDETKEKESSNGLNSSPNSVNSSTTSSLGTTQQLMMNNIPPLEKEFNLSLTLTPSLPKYTPSQATDQRSRVLDEIVVTEYIYLRDLDVISSIKRILIQDSEDNGKSVGSATPDEITAIFGNVEQLLQVNKELYMTFLGLTQKKDKKNVESPPSDLVISGNNIGEALSSMSPYLRMYSIYCSNQQQQIDTIQKVRKRSHVQNLLVHISQHSECRSLSIEDYLIKPVQRVCKYPLLLRELIKATPNTHPEYNILNTASEKVGVIVADVNEKKRRQEMGQKMVQLQQELSKGGNDVQIVHPSRVFLKEGIICHLSSLTNEFGLYSNEKPKEGYFYLFNDLFIYTRKIGLGTSSNSKVKAFIPLDMALVREPRVSTADPVFEIVHVGQKVWTFVASSIEERDSLVQQIEQTVSNSSKDSYKGDDSPSAEELLPTPKGIDIPPTHKNKPLPPPPKSPLPPSPLPPHLQANAGSRKSLPPSPKVSAEFSRSPIAPSPLSEGNPVVSARRSLKSLPPLPAPPLSSISENVRFICYHTDRRLVEIPRKNPTLSMLLEKVELKFDCPPKSLAVGLRGDVKYIESSLELSHLILETPRGQPIELDVFVV